MAALMILAACNSKTDNNSSADATDKAAADSVTTEQTVAEAEVVKVLTPADAPKAEPGKPVVIDFSAVWCGPCQEFKPVYHQVAAEYGSKATFYTADLDECTDLGKQFEVTSIPCIVILKDGAEPVKKVGYMSEGEFKALLDSSL